MNSASGLGGKLRIHHQHLRRNAEQADRREILHRVVAHLGDRRERRDGRRRRPQEGVAVRRRAGDRLGRDAAVAADAVLDDELLAERLAEPAAREPRHDVDVAAGRERHQDLGRPLRPGLGRGRRRGAKPCDGERRDGGEPTGRSCEGAVSNHRRTFTCPVVPVRNGVVQRNARRCAPRGTLSTRSIAAIVGRGRRAGPAAAPRPHSSR